MTLLSDVRAWVAAELEALAHSYEEIPSGEVDWVLALRSASSMPEPLWVDVLDVAAGRLRTLRPGDVLNIIMKRVEARAAKEQTP